MTSNRFFLKLLFLLSIGGNVFYLNAQPVEWNTSTSFAKGRLVAVGTNTYIAIQASLNVQPPNSAYWGNLKDAASALEIPVEDVPSLPAENILTALPNAEPSNTLTISILIEPSIGGNVSGNLELQGTNTTKLTAVASVGFTFTGWGGDINQTANPLSYTVQTDANITANFSQDLNDSDGDGLSNYEEVQMGTSLNESNYQLATYLSLLKAKALTEGNSTGIALVQSRPSEYGLFNQADLNSVSAVAQIAGMNTGIQSVLSNPSEYSMVSKGTHEQIIEQYIGAEESNSTPFVEGWFYIPDKDEESNESMVIELANGPVIIKIFSNEAPLHVARIKALASTGRFDQVAFHRVIDGFMAQTGDVQYGRKEQYNSNLVGTGGSALPNLLSEFNSIKHSRGICSMARASDPNSANSQFFICFQDSFFLDQQYTAWGKVVEGMTYIDQIKRGSSSNNGSVSNPDFMQKVYFHTLNEISGWVFTTRATFPYFYDASTRNWMYFQTNGQQSHFYHYGIKKWVSID